MAEAVSLKATTIAMIQHGTYQVYSGDKDENHIVSFGNSMYYPSCNCNHWQQYRFPCIHMCFVFIHVDEWSFDRLPVNYKCNALLNIDYNCIPDEVSSKVNSVHAGTQTKIKKVWIPQPINTEEKCQQSLLECLRFLTSHKLDSVHTDGLRTHINKFLNQALERNTTNKRKHAQSSIASNTVKHQRTYDQPVKTDDVHMIVEMGT